MHACRGVRVIVQVPEPEFTHNARALSLSLSLSLTQGFWVGGQMLKWWEHRSLFFREKFLPILASRTTV